MFVFSSWSEAANWVTTHACGDVGVLHSDPVMREPGSDPIWRETFFACI
jgi:hypothetical protein